MTGSASGVGVREWLSMREPSPPPELVARLASLAGEQTCDTLSDLTQFLLTTAATLLSGLENDRDAAVDLLAADALITYALEAAADDCVSIESAAERAIDVLAPGISDAR